MPYIGNQLATQFQAFVTQTITGDGSTGYTLDRAVANGKELLVYINNVKQEEGSGKSYTASGTTITFSEAVASGDSCYLVYLGSAVQTVVPPDASVVSGMIANANLELPSTLDMNGNELILDADADTSITADTDDQIDFKTSGADKMAIKADTVSIKAKASSYEGLELITPSSDASGEFHIGVHDDGGSAGRNIVFKRGGSDGMDTESMRINADGRLGIGTTDIDTPIDIVDGTEYIRIAQSVSDNTSKTGGLAVRHRDNEEEDLNVINGITGNSNNIVTIGGGDYIGSLNAATIIRFFTASDRTTVDGSQAGSVVDKLWNLYLTSSDNNYVMNVNAQGSAGASGLHNLYFKADSAVFTGYHYYAKKEPTILYVDGDTIPSGKKVGDVKTQGETFEMGDVIVLENGKATKCTKAKATNVVGIISGHPMGSGRWLSNNKDVFATEETAVEVASVGDSQDWNKIVTHYLTGFKVCNENGAIASGDLLCSANKTGYLMKQDGTAITTETVGKSMDDVTFESDGTATGIYGFLYCG